ncbi:MAG: 23S rRNA (adenine(2030)-N(6))-methyltransferase RlmJ [Gammaproteobacteria bacterium]|nr:23S rRNA (adenine(2030)-N(6))-methyltransferase RlmJ [Gammaproteobacteria bacterium]
MNYRHVFHAGNFADVHKHVVLLALLERLTRKPKPLMYLDTHAGRGWYDLRSLEALRSDEWYEGIGRLAEHTPQTDAVRRYWSLVAPSFAHGELCYPGSPILAIKQLRAADRLVFVEKQLEEAYALQQHVRRRRGVSVVHGDGYAALKTFLPPREHRGLVMIDPPYESEREVGDVLRALTFGLRRWPTGLFAVWYPIKANTQAARLHSALRDSGLRKLLLLELSVRPADSPIGLNGSGLVIANPPWQLDAEMVPVHEELHRALSPEGKGGTRIEWLVGED